MLFFMRFYVRFENVMLCHNRKFYVVFDQEEVKKWVK